MFFKLYRWHFSSQSGDLWVTKEAILFRCREIWRIFCCTHNHAHKHSVWLTRLSFFGILIIVQIILVSYDVKQFSDQIKEAPLVPWEVQASIYCWAHLPLPPRHRCAWQRRLLCPRPPHPPPCRTKIKYRVMFLPYNTPTKVENLFSLENGIKSTGDNWESGIQLMCFIPNFCPLSVDF